MTATGEDWEKCMIFFSFLFFFFWKTVLHFLIIVTLTFLLFE